MKSSSNRRQFLSMSAAAGAALALPDFASALQSGAAFQEAPQLAEQVQAGALAPVAERLPATPLVVEPLDQIGTYGGDWRLSLLPAGREAYLNTTIGYENLVRWRPDTADLTIDEVIPNVAEKFEVSADGREIAFHLRAGTKWSDGQPFSADDIIFWYNDVLLNTELTPSVPPWLTAGGEPLTVTKVDAQTVTFTFAQPAGLFIVNLATQRGDIFTNHPAHYLKQFHKTYTPGVVQLAEQAGLDDWMAFYLTKASAWENPEKPVLHAWRVTAALGDAPQQLIAERNPYYWKVDPEGNQLPYLDRAVFTAVEDEEVGVLRVLNGEVDMVDAAINELRNKAVFFDNQEEGNYHFFDTTPQQMNQMVLMLNMTHTDANKRQVFGNREFRIGLSNAINRQEIIDTLFVSQGEPWQAAPRPESVFYHEQLAKQHTEYDVDLANQQLDMILPDKDSSGVRLGLDGQPFFFTVEISGLDPDFANILEMMQQYWAAVGINASFEVEDQGLFETRTAGNQHDACVSRGGGGLGVLMDPFYYFPYNFNARYAVPWMYWYLNPKDERAIEPPAEVQQQIEFYKQIETTIDPAQQIALMKQILDIAAEQFWCLGIALRTEEYGIFSNTLLNTPMASITGWLHAEVAPNNPQQYYRQT